jgi:uncharacterized membrane protein YGL010W
MNLDLKEQLTFYGSYHHNPINQLIHVIFVPLILWSVVIWTAYTPIIPPFPPNLSYLLPSLLISNHLAFNASFFLLAYYSIYYTALNPVVGASWAVFTALPMWASSNYFQQTIPNAWLWALVLFILGWVMQIGPGHGYFEKRKPALTDNFHQSLTLAPFFVWFECLFFVGLYPGLHRQVNTAVEKNIRAWKKRAASQ